MTFETLLVASLVLPLAWVNGANDISKGVATLVGSTACRAKTSIRWGTMWTVLGGVAAVSRGTALLETFASGYLIDEYRREIQDQPK
jgi:PiT family inorganic phosphate transporter